MPDYLLVFCSCRDEDEARRIGTLLVTEQLAACANISAPVQSIYRWQGTIETAEEVTLLLKTTKACFAGLERRINQLHSYELPEVIALTITAGSSGYLAWIGQSVLAAAESS